MDIHDQLKDKLAPIQVELKSITVSLGNLLLDPNNFRLAETLPAYQDEEFEDLQERTLDKILTGYGVQDLENSILNHGWLYVDQIVVRKLRLSQIFEEPVNPPKFVVVEGNRRIAALINIISDFGERNLSSNLPESINLASKELRVMLIEGSDEEVDRASEVIMGIRHVSGPRKWGGLQAAMMVVRLIDDKGFSMSEAGKRLGISSIEANRRYRSYKAYQQAYDAGYDRANLFTLLGEAIRIKSLREWLKWDDNESCFKDENTLNLFYEKLNLNQNNNSIDINKEEKLTNPQSVRDLRKIIENPNACKILEETRSLEKARIYLNSQNFSTLARNAVSLCEQLINNLENHVVIDSLADADKKIFVKLSDLISNKVR